MLHDDSIMPSGKYKGEQMKDVPADYLLWLHDNDRASREVDAYIREHFHELVDECIHKTKR
jgi:uncharacterized protein (DUF3820 family)